MRKSFIILLLMALVVEGSLLTLAHWQYRRWQQRLNEAAAAAHAPHSTVTGVLQNTRTAALDNQPHPAGREAVGWRLLTPLKTSSQTILLDRGWLPLPADRTASPDFTPFEVSQTLTVSGVWAPLPVRHGWLRGPLTTTGPRVLAWLAPGLLTSDTLSPPGRYLQATTATGPLLLAQPSPTANPRRHLSYMLQWLGLALAFPIMCAGLFVSRRRKP